MNTIATHRTHRAGVILFAAMPIAAALGALALPVIQAIAAIWGAPWRKLPGLGRAHADWLVPLLAALAWACASAFWSISADAPLRAAKLALVLSLALLFAASAAHDEAARRWTRFGLIGGAGFLATLLLIEAFAGLPLNRLAQPQAIDMVALARNPGRGICLLVVLLYPALIALWRTPFPALRLAGILLWAIGGLLSLQLGFAANAGAFALGSAAFLFALALPRLALGLTGLAWAGWLLAAPWLSGQIGAISASLPLSWRMREKIWEFVTDRIMERPWFGWGFASSRSFAGQQSLDGVGFGNVPLHTHSASMQIWLEFGAIGAALVALAMGLATRSALRGLGKDRLAAAATCGTLAAAWVPFNASYGAWQEWWLVTLACAATACASLRAPGLSAWKPRDQRPATGWIGPSPPNP